jgi:hypothetical protein
MRVLEMRRSGRKVRAPQTSREGNAVKCEVCGTEVANSEEMKAHMEREHSLDERDEELEEPDLMDREEAQLGQSKSSGS